jgi:hypothetical protein
MFSTCPAFLFETGFSQGLGDYDNTVIYRSVTIA